MNKSIKVPYTQEQIDTLQAAIASGANTVRYGDKSVTYNSVDEMRKVLAIMKEELYPSTYPTRRKYASFDKGIFFNNREG